MYLTLINYLHPLIMILLIFSKEWGLQPKKEVSIALMRRNFECLGS